MTTKFFVIYTYPFGGHDYGTETPPNEKHFRGCLNREDAENWLANYERINYTPAEIVELPQGQRPW